MVRFILVFLCIISAGFGVNIKAYNVSVNVCEKLPKRKVFCVRNSTGWENNESGFIVKALLNPLLTLLFTKKVTEINVKTFMVSDCNSEWSKLHELGPFAHQTEYLLSKVRMSRDGAKNYSVLLFALKWELQKIWPALKLTPYGAVVSGLALTSSDLDVFITLPEDNYTTNIINKVIQAAELLKKSDSFMDIKKIFSHSVPVLSFTYKPTKQNCDMTFKKYESKGDTELLKYLLRLDSRAIPVMLIVKYWAKLHRLSRPFVAMPNLAWYYLVIFFLQQSEILPPIYVLQQEIKPKIIEHWNLAFEKSFKFYYFSKNSNTIYELLGGFFVYYANFDFEKYCVSIFAGEKIPRHLFRNFDKLPRVFNLFKLNLRNNVSVPLNINRPLCVQRPLVHSDIVGAKVDSKLFTKFVKYVSQAADIFKKTSEEHFLSFILSM